MLKIQPAPQNLIPDELNCTLGALPAGRLFKAIDLQKIDPSPHQHRRHFDEDKLRELGNIGISTGLNESFSDIQELPRRCCFTNCTHGIEIDCSVLSALESGELSEGRSRCYQKLVKESEYH